MTQQPPSTLIGRLVTDLDDTHSRAYITVALLFYIVPVILVSVLFLSASTSVRFDSAYVALLWVAIVIFPLMLTFGVFIVYRATYSNRHHNPVDGIGTAQSDSQDSDNAPLSGIAAALGNGVKAGNAASKVSNTEEWINKALDWRRFLMPLCLLNMFITLTLGVLLFADISSSAVGDIEDVPPNTIIFGFYDVQLYFLDDFIRIPGTLFYIAMFGYLTHFLEMTRRRYVSRNLVPRFYLISSFRFLQVLITAVIVFFAMQPVITDPYMMMVIAFVVGMFPLQLLTPVVDGARSRLGIATQSKLPITLINGIDNTLESLLQEENIDSIQVLATMNIREINRRTAIPKDTLENWKRQAKLFYLLGTEDLIYRFIRMGINDFDDLIVLVQNKESTPGQGGRFLEDFTHAMSIKSDEDAAASREYWRVMRDVLIQEYLREFPEAVDQLGINNGGATLEVMVTETPPQPSASTLP